MMWLRSARAHYAWKTSGNDLRADHAMYDPGEWPASYDADRQNRTDQLIVHPANSFRTTIAANRQRTQP